MLLIVSFSFKCYRFYKELRLTETLIFRNFPMSPSSNSMYSSVNGRLIKSKEAKIFVELTQKWSWSHFQKTQYLKSKWMDQTVRVDTYFVFTKSRFFTKNGKIRKLDFTNRIKAAHDCFSDILGIDDSMFLEGYFCKKYTNDSRDYIEFHVSLSAPLLHNPEIV